MAMGLLMHRVIQRVAVNNQYVLRIDSSTPVGFRMDSDGLVYAQEDSAGYVSIDTWRLSGASADYDVRATLTSGTFTTGSNNTWENLASDRTWTRGATINTSQTAVFTLEVRDAATLTVLGSATITIQCDRV